MSEPLIHTPGWHIRDYRNSDESSWLRCRVLGFLDTSYYDDVLTSKPELDPGGIELVAYANDDLVGLCDASVAAEKATIDTIVVHPDHRRKGVAGALVEEACRRLRDRGVTSVDAWTREDAGTLTWYRTHGFVHRFRYLHVYASSPAEMADAVTDSPGLMARTGHFHAWEAEEADLRRRFAPRPRMQPVREDADRRVR